MMLGFLGQVNLAELKNCYDLGLPSNGLLSFWFHQGLENGSWAVWGKVFHLHFVGFGELSDVSKLGETHVRVDLEHFIL
jgi:hypothetical protein